MSYEVSFHRELREQWNEAQLTAHNKAHESGLEGVSGVSITVSMETDCPHPHPTGLLTQEVRLQQGGGHLHLHCEAGVLQIPLKDGSERPANNPSLIAGAYPSLTKEWTLSCSVTH